MTQFRHVPDRNPVKKPIWIAGQGDRVALNEAAAEIINKSYEAVVPPPEPHKHAHGINPPPANLPVQGATFERDALAVQNAERAVQEMYEALEEKKQDIADLKAKIASLENAPIARQSYIAIAEVTAISRDGDIATIKGLTAEAEPHAITVELPASAVREAVAKKPAKPVGRRGKAQPA